MRRAGFFLPFFIVLKIKDPASAGSFILVSVAAIH